MVLTIRLGRLHVLLVHRGEAPFDGALALPGGFAQQEEHLDDTAKRELAEETGLQVGELHLEQLQTYTAPQRDPRERVITVAYLAIWPDQPEPVSGGDAAQAHWYACTDVDPTSLAFDHGTILRDGIERARSKLEYTTLATAFCPPRFTMNQLRAVYEAVWGGPLDPRNFQRKVRRSDGFVFATGEIYRPEAGRPAVLYQAGSASELFPPIRRGEPHSPRV